MDIKEINKLIKLETKRGYLFSKNLTTRSKLFIFWNNLKKSVLEFNVFNLTGLFAFVILIFYMVWYKALVLGVFGYMLYLRLEETLLKIKSTK